MLANWCVHQDNDEFRELDTVFQDETIWLIQAKMAELFDVNVPAISKHLNKMLWAITGKTAAELIESRSNPDKPNMGLTEVRSKLAGGWKPAAGETIEVEREMPQGH